jgi:hypothetical protein
MKRQDQITAWGHDPIHEHNNQWWFWDEIWVDRMGPFPTRHEAEVGLELYVHWLDTGEDKRIKTYGSK